MAPPPLKTTQEEPLSVQASGSRSARPTPGLVCIFSVDAPRCDVLPLRDGHLGIGRGEGGVVGDPQTSRMHANVRFDGRLWEVEDLGSRNGTWVDGERLEGARAGADLKVVRTGSSVFLLQADVEPFRAGVSRVHGTLVGPALARVWASIARAAGSHAALHITGESGTGKEHAARAFHGYGPRRDGPFVAVNCATLSGDMAGAQLFGWVKSAFTDAKAGGDGYVKAAHGGVLFLDEVAELDLGVQAKLLRALEAKEVIPIGAARPVKVDFALVSATLKDLRAQVAAGKLREDLLYRIARRGVVLPALRERLEEMPWYVDEVLRREAEAAGARSQALAPLKAHASLIEACLLRAWPGNVRELLSELEAAAQEARSAESRWVTAAHLLPSAGQAVAPPLAPSPSAALPPSSFPQHLPYPPALPPSFAPAPPPPQPAPEAARTGATARRGVSLPADAVIEEALRREGGNIARTARALGVHRTQLCRWIKRRRAAPPGRADTEP
ncbi:sigma 54-interacting transcriptional regulator [Sorangium sp. So ce1335]|uniref:sigma 54-interacting transcriptional regulator n=1 Tax=Sorangium sp. So ce1335 TaxID=3133335 RepID=UPI003F6457BE